MFCKNCGEENREENLNCSKCNKIIVSEKNAKEEVVKIESIQKIILGISILIIISILMAGLYFNQSKHKVNGNRGNTVGNINNYGYCVAKDGWIYYSDYQGDQSIIYKINGSKRTQLIKEQKANVFFLNVVDGWIYYNKADLSKRDAKGLPVQSIICRMKTDGTEKTEISTTGLLDHFSVVDGFIYYSYFDSSNKQKVCKMKMDGSEKKEVLNTNKLILNFNVVNNWMYYIEIDNSTHTGRIYKDKVDGSDKKELTKEEKLDLFDLNVEGDCIYYKKVDKKTKAATICKMKTDGSGKVEISQEDACAWSILNVTNNWIYYMKDTKDLKDGKQQNYNCTIYKVKTDGSKKTEIFNKGMYISRMNIVGEWIYYTKVDMKTSEMRKMKLDGTEDGKV